MDQQTQIMDQTFSLEELARLRALLQVTLTAASTTPLISQLSHSTTVSSVPVPLLPQPSLQNISTTQLPLLTQLYQSSCQQSLPQGQTTAASSVATARFQPYPSIGTIGLNLATGHANLACMASTLSSIPHQAPLSH